MVISSMENFILDIYTVGKDGKRKMAGLLERVESLEEATPLDPLEERRTSRPDNSETKKIDNTKAQRRREDIPVDPVSNYLKGVFSGDETSDKKKPANHQIKQASPNPQSQNQEKKIIKPFQEQILKNPVDKNPKTKPVPMKSTTAISPHSNKNQVQAGSKLKPQHSTPGPKEKTVASTQLKNKKMQAPAPKEQTKSINPLARELHQNQITGNPSPTPIETKPLKKNKQENQINKINKASSQMRTARGWVATNPTPKKGQIIRIVAIILSILLILETGGSFLFSYFKTKAQMIEQNNRIVDETSGQLEWRIETIVNAAYILFAEKTLHSSPIFDKSNYIIYMGVLDRSTKFYNNPLLERNNLTKGFIDDVILNLKWTERKISEDNMFLFNASGRMGFPVMGIVTPVERSGRKKPLIILVDLRKIIKQEYKDTGDSLFPRSTFILNSDGDVLIHPIESYITNFTNYSNKIFFEKTISSEHRIQLEYTDSNGENFLASSYRIPLTGGIVVSQQQKNDLYKGIWRNIWFYLTISALTLLLTIFILLCIPRRIYENKGRWMTWEESPMNNEELQRNNSPLKRNSTIKGS